MYKIAKLVQQEQKLFHTGDLAVLWGIENKNTLYTTIKRYVQKEVLYPVYKGLYSTVPLTRISPERLGVAVIHGYTYLSCEAVLSREGIISQAVIPLTFVSLNSRRFKVGDMEFLVRRMDPKFLYQTAGIIETGGVKVANLERAVADMLYFNPKYHFDNPAGIDWENVKLIQREVGYR